MGIAKHLDIRSLLEVYSYANTPRYLYRHFRENHSLTQLPQAYSPEDLIAEYRRRTDKASPSLEDVVVAYAIVVAVTFLPYKDAVSTFDQLELERLDWGGDLKDIFESTVRITSITERKVKPRLEQYFHAVGIPGASQETPTFLPKLVVETGSLIIPSDRSDDSSDSIRRIRYQPEITSPEDLDA